MINKIIDPEIKYKLNLQIKEKTFSNFQNKAYAMPISN